MTWVRVLLAAILALASSSAIALGCGPKMSLSEAVNSSDEFVFKGRVLRVLPKEFDSLPVTFSVIRSYRGQPPQLLTVYFFSAYDPRPLAFHEGDEFLISTGQFRIYRKDNPEPEIRSMGNACKLRMLVRMAH